MSTLGGQTIAVIAECMIPPAGGWLADLTLETGGLPTVGARLALTIADLSLVGMVLRRGYDLPDQPRVVVAGGGGWRTPLTRASYQSVTGVRLLTVVRDLASIAKEPYDAPADASLGNAYGWPASLPLEPVDGRTVLASLVRRKALPTWRVAPNGRTRFDAWPTLGAADNFCRIEDRNLAQGVRFLALDNRAAAFLPGAAVEGATIRRVIFRETSGDLRAEAWTS